MLFHMAESCDTPESKDRRNREYKACLREGAIPRLLDHGVTSNSGTFLHAPGALLHVFSHELLSGPLSLKKSVSLPATEPSTKVLLGSTNAAEDRACTLLCWPERVQPPRQSADRQRASRQDREDGSTDACRSWKCFFLQSAIYPEGDQVLQMLILICPADQHILREKNADCSLACVCV